MHILVQGQSSDTELNLVEQMIYKVPKEDTKRN